MDVQWFAALWCEQSHHKAALAHDHGIEPRDVIAEHHRQLHAIASPQTHHKPLCGGILVHDSTSDEHQHRYSQAIHDVPETRI